MRAPTFFALALALSLVAPGCRSFEEEPERPRPDRRKVNLPETPPLAKKELRVKADDGSYTVPGLLASASEEMGEAVVVRGIVVDKVECPVEELPESDAGVPAEPPAIVSGCHPPPHLFLTDDLARPTKQILVTGTAVQIAAVSVAQPVRLEGRLVQWSADKVFVRTEGMLQLEVPDEAPPAPPGSIEAPPAPTEAPSSPDARPDPTPAPMPAPMPDAAPATPDVPPVDAPPAEPPTTP